MVQREGPNGEGSSNTMMLIRVDAVTHGRSFVGQSLGRGDLLNAPSHFSVLDSIHIFEIFHGDAVP